MTMEREELKQHLSKSYELLKRYTDNKSTIEAEKFRIMFYNKNTRYVYLGFAVGWVLYLVAYHFFIRDDQIVVAGLVCFGIGIIGMRKFIGPMLDKRKKGAMKEAARLKFEPLVREMDEIALKLEVSDILPEKYRTLHAVSHLLEYVQNKRIDTLKEGLNLYEDEMSKQLQQQRLNQVVQQNQRMIFQNDKMIQQQREMIRAQRTTNDLLHF